MMLDDLTLNNRKNSFCRKLPSIIPTTTVICHVLYAILMSLRLKLDSYVILVWALD